MVAQDRDDIRRPMTWSAGESVELQPELRRLGVKGYVVLPARYT